MFLLPLQAYLPAWTNYYCLVASGSDNSDLFSMGLNVSEMRNRRSSNKEEEEINLKETDDAAATVEDLAKNHGLLTYQPIPKRD